MRTLITLVVVLFCLQLWAQVPDTTSVAPGRLIIKVNQAFQTIGTRSDGIIDPEQGSHDPVFTQTRMHMDAIEFAGIPPKKTGNDVDNHKTYTHLDAENV